MNDLRTSVEFSINSTLYNEVNALSKKTGEPINTIVLDLLKKGLNKFDRESVVVSPAELLLNYKLTSENEEMENKTNWMLMADRNLIMKIRLRSGEYCPDLSFFLNYLINGAIDESYAHDEILQ